MPVSADYQIELRSTVMGDGTNYQFGPAGEVSISGLGVPAPKTADVELLHADGSYGSADYQGIRVITIPYILLGTATQVFTWLGDLRTIWAPSTTDLTMTIRLPGFGTHTVTGRPRGLDENLRNAQFGEITALGTFVCLDPTIT